MAIFFRALRLLAMTVWVGGLIFFAFILAPMAFSTLPSTHEAGTIVGGTLRVLNTAGIICGIVFLVATIAMAFRTETRSRRFYLAESLLILGMIFTTSAVQHGIVPAMERDRIAAGGDIDAAAAGNPERQDFERLHALSEKVEGSALLLGIINIVLIAAEHGTRRRIQPYVD